MSTKPINDDNDIDDIFCTKLGRPTFHRSNRVCKHRIFAFSKCVKIVSLTFYYNNCQFNLNFIPINSAACQASVFSTITRFIYSKNMYNHEIVQFCLHKLLKNKNVGFHFFIKRNFKRIPSHSSQLSYPRTTEQ